MSTKPVAKMTGKAAMKPAAAAMNPIKVNNFFLIAETIDSVESRTNAVCGELP